MLRHTFKALQSLQYLILFACLFGLGVNEAKATHAMGGDITFTCVGPYQYLVTYTYYRDCNGVGMPGSVGLEVESAQCGANFFVNLPLDDVQIVTPICTGAPDVCNDPSGIYGIERYKYVGVVDLQPFPGCGTDWIFSIAFCCRNNAITSLVNPGSKNMFLYAIVDNTVDVCNNSPVFLTDPTPYTCVGQPNAYNHGYSDQDGDSLSFALVQSLDGDINSPIAYQAPYSLTDPILTNGGLDAVAIDPVTGTITFVANQQQVAVLTVRVEEWRSGVKIGEYLRDIQITVLACSNNYPTITGINGSGDYTVELCANNSICFDVTGSDPDLSNVLTMFWNQGVPGATFNVTGSNPVTGTFCWTPNAGQVGQYLFTTTVVDDACLLSGQNTYGYVITVTPPFEPADAGPDLFACGSTTLQGSISTSDVPATWQVVSGSGNFSDPSDPTAFVTGMSLGLNVFQWTVDYGTCGITTDQVTVLNFSPSQQPASAGADIEVCGPNASTNLSGNSLVFPASGTWSLISGSGTIVDPNDPNTLVTNLGTGQNRFRWTVDNGPCGGITVDDVFVDVFSPITSFSAGPDQSLCTPVSAVQLNGTSISYPTSGQWNVISGTGSFSNANSSSPQVFGVPVGTHQFEWVADNGPCGISRDTVEVSVFDSNAAAANAGNDVELCTPTSSISMSGNFPVAPATGQWSLVSGQGNIVSPSSNTSAINNLGVGQNVFQWTVFNGSCGTTSDLVTVTVYDQSEPAANAGPDQDLCTPTSSTNLGANSTSAPAVGTWTLTSGSGIIADPNDANSSVSGLGVGVNVFTWTVYNGPCAVTNTSDAVSIVVYDNNAPSADAGPDQSLCAPASSTNLAGNVATSPAMGMWSLVSGPNNPSFANANNPASAVNGLVVGEYVFRWTIDNGPCSNAITSDDIVVQVYDPNNPIANAGADQEICSPTSTASLQGSAIISPAFGVWSVISGNGNFADASDPNTVVSGLPIGVHVFEWSVFNGPCANPITTDQVTISVFDPNTASADAGPDQELCTPALSTTLAGSAYSTPATGTWSQVSGTSTATFTDATDPNTSVTGLAVGSFTFRWTISNGACLGSPTSDDVVIDVFDNLAPSADAGSDQSLCSVFSTTLTGNAPVGVASGTWSLISGSGTLANAANSSTFVSGLSFGENVFQWTIDNGACGQSSDVVSIFVFNSADPVANAGPDQDICTPITTTVLSGSSFTAPATGTWSVISGTAVVSDVNDPNSVVTGLTIGTHVLQWQVDAGVCPNGVTNDQMIINVFSGSATPADAGPDQNICNTPATTSLAGNAPVGVATGTWTVVSGSGNIANANNPSTSVTNLGIGQNILRWSIDNGACGISNDFVSIFVFDDANPLANAGADQQLCSPTSSTLMSGSSLTFPATGTWSVVSGTATIVDVSDPNTNVTGLPVGTHVLQWTVDNGPCSNPSTNDQVTIEVFDENAPQANAGPDQDICGPNVDATMAANAPTSPATGNWVSVSGSGSIADASNPSTLITGLPVGVHVFRWVIDNGPCSNSITSDDVTINVFDPADPIANAGADQQLCTPATTSTLNGSLFTVPAFGAWTVISGTGTVDDPFDPNSGVSGLSVGTHVFQWNVDNGPCPNGLTTDQVTIEVFDDSNPVANAGPDQDICTPLTSATLAGSSLIAPASGVWTVVSGTGTFTDATDPNTLVSGLSIGANTFQWTVDNGPCSNPTTNDQVTINLFNGSAQQADAGPDQSFCSTTTSTSMAANAPVGVATGAWTLIQGTATITNITDPTTTVTGMGVGEIILEWSIDNGACGVSNDQISIFIYDQNDPVASAGADQQLCTPTLTTNLNGSVPTIPSIGTWTLISGNGTITDINDPSTSVTGLTVGENVFQWSVDNGPCPNGVTNDQVSIFVFDEANPIANAGADQQICTPQTSVTMAGSALIFPATGNWTVVNGTANIVDPTDPLTVVNGLVPGTVVLQWTVDNGPCPSGITNDQVAIQIFNDADPVANAGPDQEICIPTVPAQVTLGGSTVTSPSVGTWTLVCGNGTIADPNDPNTNVTGLTVGLNCFVWTVSNGPCTNPTSNDTVVVSVFDAGNPTADAGPDQSLCTPINFATLSGSTPIFPAQGTWSVVSGSGTFVDVNDPNTQVTALGIGINVLQWTVSNGPCAPPTTQDQVTITLYDGNAQVSDAGPDQQICSDNPTTALAANSPSAAATGLWTISSGSAIFADATQANTTVSGLQVGETVLLWTIDNGSCGSSVDSVSLFIYDSNLPDADAGADQDLCTPVTSTSMAAVPAIFPAVGTWSLVSGSGVIVDSNNPNSTISGLGVGTNIFQWTVDNGPCANPITSDQVAIVVFDNNAPVADAGADQDLCSDNPNTTVNGSSPVGSASGIWTVASGSGTFFSANSPSTAVTGLSIGQNDLVWTIDNGFCGMSSDTLSIFVYDAGNANADAGPDQDLCTPITSAILAGSSVTFPAQGTWTLISGTGVLNDVNDPSSTVNGLSIGSNVFQWSVDNGPCANGITTDLVTINVFNGGAQLADAGADQSFCSPQDTALLAANAVTGVATGQWSLTQGTGVFSDANDPNTVVSGLTVGENILTWTIDNGSCGTSADQVSVFIFDENNPIANAGPDQQLCTPTSSATLSGSTVTFPAQGTWTIVSGTATISDINDPNATLTGLQIGDVVIDWTVDNGPCNSSPSSDLITITLFDDTQTSADAGPDQLLCTPNISTTMTGNAVAAPALGTWTLLSGTGLISNINDPLSSISGLTVGENVFEWSVFNGACPNGLTRDTVSIFIFDDSAPNADAGLDLQICTPASSVNLSGNAPIFPATGSWSLVNGSGTIADITDPNTAVTNLPVGTHVFAWTIDNGPCPNGITSDQVVVEVFDENNLNADAGADILLCTPTTFTQLNGSAIISPAVGTWTVISGNGTFSDVNDPLATVNDLVIGINSFVWTVNNGNCPNGVTSDTLDVILFDNTGVPSDAGPDQSLCTPNTSVVMGGSAVTFPEIGVWLTFQGGGTFANINDPQSAVSNLPVGENIFVWSVNNGPCPSGTTGDTVSIFIFDENNPNADAGPDQNLCLPTTSTTMNGSANTFPAIGTWTLIQGSGLIADTADPNAAISGLSVGENIFVWTVDNGPCANSITRDTVSIFIYSDTVSAANAGADIDLCTSAPTTNLAGSPYVFPATGNWTVISGAVTFTDPTDPNTAISGVALGVSELVWTVDNGPCPAGLSSDTVVIQLFNDNSPTANAGPDQSICTPQSSVTLAGNSPVGLATSNWNVIQGPASLSFVDATDPVTILNGIQVGETILTWNIDNGVCGVTVDTMSIFVFDENSPVADAGVDIQLCTPEDSVLLTAIPPIFPATATWSVVQGGAAIVDASDPNSLATGLTFGTNIFALQVDNGPCVPGITFDTLVVTLFSDTTAPANAGLDQQICLPNNSTTLTAVPTLPPAVGTWSVASGSGVFADVNDPASVVTGMTIGDNVFVWTLNNGPCANNGITVDTVVVTLYNDQHPVADAGLDQENCLPNSSVIMQANSYTYPASGYWTVLSGQANIVDTTNPNTLVDNLVVGTATLLWTIDNGPCPAGITTDTVDIRLFDPTAPLADAGPNDSICTPSTSLFLNAATPAIPGFGVWSLVSGNAQIADTLDPNTQITGLTVGVHVFEWFLYNGFCGFGTITSRDTVEVYVYDENSPAADAGSDQDICFPAQNSVTMAANSPIFPAFGTWSSPTGSGTITDTSNPLTTVTGLSMGVHQFVWTSFNGPCAGSVTTDTVIIRVFDNNAPDPDAGPDQAICVPTAANQVTMAGNQASFPGNGYWSLISGSATIVDSTLHNTLISDLVVGTHLFTWTIVNGPCWTRQDTMMVEVFDDAQTSADAGSDQILCTPVSSANLSANAIISPATGTWTILSGAGTLSDASDPTATLNGLVVGDVVLVWSVDNGPCANGITRDTVLIQLFDSNADPAMAGPDQDFCTPISNPVTMFANSAILPAIGTWVLVSGTATIDDPNNPFTGINNLGLGDNVFEWQIDNGGCGTGTTTDQITISVFDSGEPAADAGESVIYCQDISEHQLAPIDSLTTGTGFWSILTSDGSLLDASDPNTTVIDLPEGEHILQWTVDNGTCGTTIDTMMVIIEDCLTLTIPDAFSPNGDNVNDLFVIDNIESYPDNNFKVFNRWGTKVLDRNGYNNDWNGTSEHPNTWGEELPESTYYYVLELGGDLETFNGFIYIKR